MHEDVKRFYLDGEVDYERLSQAKQTLEETLIDKMRIGGYAPVLDIDPQLSQEFDHETNKFKITISLYGAYVGEDTWDMAGLMFGKPVKSTTMHKSNLS